MNTISIVFSRPILSEAIPHMIREAVLATPFCSCGKSHDREAENCRALDMKRTRDLRKIAERHQAAERDQEVDEIEQPELRHAQRLVPGVVDGGLHDVTV
jgi:hypothetical protein